MSSPQEALVKLRDFVDRPKAATSGELDPEEEQQYAARVQKSLLNLQKQVAQAEADIKKRREAQPTLPIEQPSRDVVSRIQQLRAITAAYKKATDAEPLLPSADSPLPALLALRSALVTIEQTKQAIRACNRDIAEAKVSLEREQSYLQLGRSMDEALQTHLADLESERRVTVEEGQDAVATQIWKKQEGKKASCTQEMKRLVAGLNKFSDDYLGIMIAAEDLGGPVVGDNLDLDEMTLREGFDKQGRPKQASKGKAQDSKNDTNNLSLELQRKKDAAQEFRRLTENLMNAAVDEDSKDTYITINKESASVRLLIRAKVAEFHPQDARRIRLVNFGASLQDRGD